MDWYRTCLCSYALGSSKIKVSETYKGGGGVRGGIFRCGKFRTSNVCKISRSIFRPLCEINPVQNLATDAKFSHWGFAGFAGGMLLPPPPLLPWVLQLFSFQGKLDSQPECYDLQGWEALFVQEKSIFSSDLPL